MRFAAGLHRVQRRDVLLHCHHCRAGQLLQQRVAFHVIAMSMAANFDVAELEAELFDALANRRDRRL